MVVTVVGVAIIAFIGSRDFAVLDPKGTIAAQQRDLLVFASLLSLVVIVPVFALTYHIVRTYRVGAKKKAKYSPDWDHDRKLETLWWGIPSAIIVVLSVVAWQTSHSLDPFKPLVSDRRPLTIQVVALEWKWLFLYPEQQIATVNYVQFPADRPVNFEITADAPMNSFWIPQLGGQIYAMSGMTTKLHLMASETGTFQGSSANLSGDGFAGMRFKAQATTDDEFNLWSKVTRNSQNRFGSDSYAQLAARSSDTEPATYALEDLRLYDKVLMKYMGHGEITDSHGGAASSTHTDMEAHGAGN